MDANQLADGIARAVEAAKPAAEYCLLATKDHWWTVCMTKAEWSGWMQAIGSLAALLIAIGLPYLQAALGHKKNFQLARQCLIQQIALLYSIQTLFTSCKPKDALYRSREAVETLSLTYQEVRISELPRNALPAWLSARTTAGQLQSLISSLATLAGSEQGLERIIANYTETSERNLADFSARGN